VVHVAGPFVANVQHCARCGAIIADYRNTWSTGDSSPPPGWSVGAYIEVAGNCSTITPAAPSCPVMPGQAGVVHQLAGDLATGRAHTLAAVVYYASGATDSLMIFRDADVQHLRALLPGLRRLVEQVEEMVGNPDKLH
jgi:hypothetical protein